MMRCITSTVLTGLAPPRWPLGADTYERIAGAGSDRAKERPVASPAEVVTLLEAITPRYRAAVLLAAWCGLRRGEIVGLRLEDVNVGSATVTVRRNRVELLENDRAAFDADPKTDAGKRTVAIPPHV